MAMNRNATVEQTQARQEKYGGTVRGMYLENFAAMGMLPTPTTRDYKSGVSPNAMIRKDGKSRADQLSNIPVMIGKHRSQTGTISHQLNPQFVAEMMGFPTDWTELPFLSGNNNP
jgi:hypothetical protein